MRTLYAATVAAVILAAGAVPATAQTYASVGYTEISSDQDLGAVTGRIGWLAPNPKISFGVEGEAAVGVKDETVSGVTAKITSEFAGYGIATLNTLGTFQPYIRVGYGTTRLKGSSGAVSVSLTEDSVNYGAGAFINITPKDSIRIDYTRFDFQDSGAGSGDTYGISYTRKF